MPYTRHYAEREPARAEIDALTGDSLIEFGAPWCGHCIAAQPAIERAMGAHPSVRHFKIEDGRGRPLGRSFRIKLWPTLVLVRDGIEAGRVVRPREAREVEQLFAASMVRPATPAEYPGGARGEPRVPPAKRQ